MCELNLASLPIDHRAMGSEPRHADDHHLLIKVHHVKPSFGHMSLNSETQFNLLGQMIGGTIGVVGVDWER